MREHIKKRKDFSDVDVNKTTYILYAPYEKTPSCEDFKRGKKITIVLRNGITGELEEISCTLTGAVPFVTRPGYHWFWGEIDSSDHHCCLVFNYRPNGEIDKITVSFCGESMSSNLFARANEIIGCPAQITAVGPFGSIPF